jgi:hypothetical protein
MWIVNHPPHRLAIQTLEREIRDNLTTKYRCIAYGDPQEEIDVYDRWNEQLQATISVLLELQENADSRN